MTYRYADTTNKSISGFGIFLGGWVGSLQSNIHDLDVS